MKKNPELLPLTNRIVDLLTIKIAIAMFLFAPSALAGEAPPAGSQSKPLWQQIKEGGWVMFPIALCSVATVYLIADGCLRTSHRKTAPAEQTAAIKNLFRQGDYVGAYHYCKANPSA